MSYSEKPVWPYIYQFLSNNCRNIIDKLGNGSKPVSVFFRQALLNKFVGTVMTNDSFQRYF